MSGAALTLAFATHGHGAWIGPGGGGEQADKGHGQERLFLMTIFFPNRMPIVGPCW